MKIFVIVVAALFAAGITSADAANKPCSGKKGGVSSCTAGGKFICRDGSVSASKKICSRN